MTSESMWPEINQVTKENRHELILSGAIISQKIAETGLDRALFNLQNLNYLNINQTCLKDIPEEIGRLENLTTLVLHSNKITKIPTSIKKLTKLKVLDCSRNELNHLPQEMENLPQLTTINLAANLLKELPSQALNVRLSTLDLSNNQFESFPDVCHPKLIHLAEIKVNGNQIKEIPGNISVLTSLKLLDVADNLISAVPGELAECSKLKELNLKGNVLSDKRLLKLVDQCRTKQVLEYIRQHCPKSSGNAVSVGSKSKKGKKGHKASEIENNAVAENRMTHKIRVLKLTQDTPVIKITDCVKTVRPHIVACIVKNLTFTEQSFKKFIQLQTKLHEGICEKRNAATLATHDLNLFVPGDLTYTAKSPEDVKIKPLMRDKTYTGAALFEELQLEADNLRKEKKRNVYSGIHRYLYLLEGKPLYPCLLDSTGQVISFPPITNSDITKMSPNTREMFLEVTSASSQQICKKVLDQFLKDLVTLGLGCSPIIDNAQEYHDLSIEQVKVVDLEGNLKHVYPSRTDLNFDENNIIIIRE